MSRRVDAIALCLAFVLGGAIAYVDSRPTWDDTGITALALVAAGGLIGLMRPTRPWLCAAILWAWIPAFHLAANHRFDLGTLLWLLVLLFPLAGAYGGVLARRVLAH